MYSFSVPQSCCITPGVGVGVDGGVSKMLKFHVKDFCDGLGRHFRQAILYADRSCFYCIFL